MQVSRNNLLFILLFVGGIILPTAILAVLSFRNIQNEIFLAQKNFNENRTAFQNDVEESVLKEQHKVFLETKNASLFLYEQPQRLLDLVMRPNSSLSTELKPYSFSIKVR